MTFIYVILGPSDLYRGQENHHVSMLGGAAGVCGDTELPKGRDAILELAADSTSGRDLFCN
jgi:hypothetical protein